MKEEIGHVIELPISFIFFFFFRIFVEFVEQIYISKRTFLLIFEFKESTINFDDLERNIF